VNKTCVVRTELVGGMEPGGTMTNTETRCAPPPYPTKVICSPPIISTSCLSYDRATEPADSVNVNAMVDSALQAIQKYDDAEPKQLSLLPLDMFDMVWTALCNSMYFHVFRNANEPIAKTTHRLISCCMTDKIMCTTPMTLYKWKSVVLINSTLVQIAWKVHSDGGYGAYVRDATLLGNPPNGDVDTTVVGIRYAVEGFSEAAARRPSSSVATVAAVAAIVIVLVACVASLVRHLARVQI